MCKVKEEKFGTRPTNLQSVFDAKGIEVVKGLWLITSIKNKNKETRYILIIDRNECREDVYIKGLIDNIKECITCFEISINKDNEVIVVSKNSDDIYMSYEEFKGIILKTIKAKYIKSSAKGSPNASLFSKFCRENLGSGVSITDIDYFMLRKDKNFIIEEKTLVNNGKCYIGIGQCLSLFELQNDVFINTEVVVACEYDSYIYVSGDSIGDIKKELKSKIVDVPGWGKMVEVKMKKGVI